MSGSQMTVVKFKNVLKLMTKDFQELNPLVITNGQYKFLKAQGQLHLLPKRTIVAADAISPESA